MVDISRGTTGVRLDPAVSRDIWAGVVEQSIVQRLATEVPLPGSGVSVDVITGEATASWVAETAVKPVSRPTVDNKLMSPHMLTVIVPFSNQFRRDKVALYNALVQRLPAALAKKFDQTVFGYFAAPGTGFDTLALSPTTSINTPSSVYANMLGAMGTIAAAGGELTDIISSQQALIKLLGVVDGNQRPLFTTDPTSGQLTSVLAPLRPSRHVYNPDAAGVGGVSGETLAIAGDWGGSAFWGQVEAIDVSLSDQATLYDTSIGGDNLLHLWQRNMFALRVEVEVGFVVKDDDRFVRLLGADAA